MSDDKVTSIIRALPNLAVLTGILDRDFEVARRNGVLLTLHERAELKIAIHLLQSIEYAPAPKPKSTKGVDCKGCGRNIVGPGEAVMALPLCWSCMALQNLVTWAEFNPHEISLASLRFKGHHYGCVSNPSLDDPLMAVTLHTGARVVTTGLRYQGPVPDAYRDLLKDNCVIVQGNPEGLPLGVTV